MTLSPGQRIVAPFLPASAVVKGSQHRPGYHLLEVVLDDGNQTYRSLRLTEDQPSQIQIDGQSTLARMDDPEELFLYIEAHRLRLAHQFDPQLAVSVSQVDPLPHQIEAVYHYILPYPRVRFLIADDTGTGNNRLRGDK